MAKKTKKKTQAPKKSKPAKEKLISWFVKKIGQKKLKAHQLDEIKAYFEAIKLDTEQEEMGNYDKAFERF